MKPSPIWRLRPADEKHIQEVQEAIGVGPCLARILVGRGILDGVAAKKFLDPKLTHLVSPAAMAGLEAASQRLADAVVKGERIAIFGDYDVDGVSAAAVLGDYLQRSGGEVTLRVARRDEGYGFQPQHAAEMAARSPRVLVLVDCGTSDAEAVARACALGVDVIAVDHHRGDSGDWPGLALINPQQAACGFPYKGLCSAGLAFYLAAALRRELLSRGVQTAGDPRDLLDLVALGTIADVAPLDGVNRILVSRGLQALSRTSRPGLRELLRLGGVAAERVSVSDVAWRVAPRLNAPGRLGDAGVALRCLFDADAQVAREAARRCEVINEQRKAIQQGIWREAAAQAQRKPASPLAFVAGRGWHPGVVGIVAAKLAGQFARPAVVVALDGSGGRGSARCPDGFNVFELFQRCSRHLVRFGGHAAAAGFCVELEQLASLEAALEAETKAMVETQEPPAFDVDASLVLEAVDELFCASLDRLGPFGQGNPRPVLAASYVQVCRSRVVGENHLSLMLRQGARELPGIAFGMAGEGLNVGDQIDVAFSPEIDTFEGRRVRLRVLALARAGEGLNADAQR